MKDSSKAGKYVWIRMLDNRKENRIKDDCSIKKNVKVD